MALEGFLQFLTGQMRPTMFGMPTGPAAAAGTGGAAGGTPAAPKTFEQRQQEAFTTMLENAAKNPGAGAGGMGDIGSIMKSMRRDPLGDVARANSRMPGFTPQAAWDAWGPSARKKAPESDARAGIRVAGGDADPRIAAAQAPDPRYWGPGAPSTPAAPPAPGARPGVPGAPAAPVPVPAPAPQQYETSPFPGATPAMTQARPDTTQGAAQFMGAAAPNIRPAGPMSWLDQVAQNEGATMEDGTWYGPADTNPPLTTEGQSPHTIMPGRGVQEPGGNWLAQVAEQGGAVQNPDGTWQTPPLPDMGPQFAETMPKPFDFFNLGGKGPQTPTEPQFEHIMRPESQPIEGMSWLDQVAQTAQAQGGPGNWNWTPPVYGNNPNLGTTQVMRPESQNIPAMDWLSQVAQTAGATQGPDGGYSLPGATPQFRAAAPDLAPAPAPPRAPARPQFRPPTPQLPATTQNLMDLLRSFRPGMI